MIINSIRIYAEVLEQGLDFKKYIQKLGYSCEIQNIYTKKPRTAINESDSLIDKIRKVKDVDVLITIITDKKEFPLLMVEYSTAVPTDDHKMQRSDVYFWGALFQVPIMKISPSNKGMKQDFGGGSRITNELEIILANKIGAIFYPIIWENCLASDSLKTNPNHLSCIDYTNEISEILEENLSIFTKAQNYSDYYKNLLSSYQNKYRIILSSFENFDLKSLIVNSSRFNWLDEKLCVKINRFGHAMDPDRGILYFVNMLVGSANAVTEIQVNRPKEYNSRGGYKSLFDATSRETKLKKYIENIIQNNNNEFCIEDAFYVLLNGLNIDEKLQFSKISEKEFFIEDNILETFLFNYPSMTTKSIFYLTTELHLTDVNREIICKIKWNKKPIDEYFKSLVYINNYKPISIQPLKKAQAKEDIITYSCVELYKKLKHELLAVSYPGAQGDRCILCGQGRKVLRTYIDIITYKKNENNIKLFLHECKEKFEQTKSDVLKLKNIHENKDSILGLSRLCKKVANLELDNESKIYLALGAKSSNNIDNIDVDYIFLFDILNNEKKTIIEYSIAIINLNLIEEFKTLVNTEGKLKGNLIFDIIYSIDE